MARLARQPRHLFSEILSDASDYQERFVEDLREGHYAIRVQIHDPKDTNRAWRATPFANMAPITSFPRDAGRSKRTRTTRLPDDRASTTLFGDIVGIGVTLSLGLRARADPQPGLP